MGKMLVVRLGWPAMPEKGIELFKRTDSECKGNICK
jgi:hypothetical protein